MDDTPRLAAFLGMSVRAFEKTYVYATKNTRRLRRRDGKCPFLKLDGCSVHPAKPTQCRLFPFWPELVEDKRALRATARWCPGIGKGEVVSVETLMESARELKKAYPDQYGE